MKLYNPFKRSPRYTINVYELQNSQDEYIAELLHRIDELEADTELYQEFKQHYWLYRKHYTRCLRCEPGQE